MELIGKFHIIDIIAVLFFIRICYISFVRGIVVELLKAVSLFLASFFSLQYYRDLFGEVFERGPFGFSRVVVDGAAFLIIFFVTALIFFLIRKVATLLFRRETIPTWEKYGSLAVGLCRASFLMSVILFVLLQFQAASSQIKQSISYRLFRNLAPTTYIVSFSLFKKLNPQNELNQEVRRYYEAQNIIP